MIREHTTGKNYDSTVGLLEDKLGFLPPRGMERSILIRNKIFVLKVYDEPGNAGEFIPELLAGW